MRTPKPNTLALAVVLLTPWLGVGSASSQALIDDWIDAEFSLVKGEGEQSFDDAYVDGDFGFGRSVNVDNGGSGTTALSAVEVRGVDFTLPSGTIQFSWGSNSSIGTYEDLRAAGSHVGVSVESVPGELQVTLTLSDGSTGGDSMTTSVNAPGRVAFPLDAFRGVNTSSVREVFLELTATASTTSPFTGRIASVDVGPSDLDDPVIQDLLSLMDTVRDLGLPNLNGPDLLAPLQRAAEQVDSDRLNAASGQLHAFLAQVSRLERQGVLSATEADGLRELAASIDASL